MHRADIKRIGQTILTIGGMVWALLNLFSIVPLW